MSYELDFSFLDQDPYEHGDEGHEHGGTNSAAGGSDSGTGAEVPVRDMMRDQADAVRSADEDEAAKAAAAAAAQDPQPADDDTAASSPTLDAGASGASGPARSTTGTTPQHDDTVVAGESSSTQESPAADPVFETMLAGAGSADFDAASLLADSSFSWQASGEKVKVQLPPVLIQALRDQLMACLIEQWRVPADQARAFAERRSQAGLVVAFLAAQLDLRLSVDAATSQSAAAFACLNPLLGRVVSQLHHLGAQQQATNAAVTQIQQGIRTGAQPVEAIELMTAWLVAERVGTGIASGKYLVTDVDLHDTRVREMTHRARGEATSQRERERRAEGRRRA